MRFWKKITKLLLSALIIPTVTQRTVQTIFFNFEFDYFHGAKVTNMAKTPPTLSVSKKTSKNLHKTFWTNGFWTKKSFYEMGFQVWLASNFFY